MNNPKRIAYIFEEARVFLTKDGLYYRYDETDGRIQCRKLTREEKNDFLCVVRPQEAKQKDNAEETIWQPVAREGSRIDKEEMRSHSVAAGSRPRFQNGKFCGVR